MDPDARPSHDALEQEEREHASERAAVEPQVVHEAIRLEGVAELERPPSALAWSALAAGMSMGFSLVAEGTLRALLPAASWTPLVAKLGYSVGFLVVVLGRQQLFTETTLTAVLPLLDAPSARRLGAVARVWAVVLAGNVVGALAFAFLVTRRGIVDPAVQSVFEELGREAIAPSFATTMLRGVLGGWLIALMVWLLPAAETARFFVVVVITWLVGVGEFSHIVAGSVEVFVLVVDGRLSLAGYLGEWLVPTFLGNSLGGVAFVAALNHAHVAATLRERRT